MHSWVADGVSRLDVFLSKQDAGISRVRARDVIKDGLVMVNDRIARKPALILKEGDKVQCSADGAPVTETRLKGVDLTLDVLYEDDACMVIQKPAGIAVHPGAGLPPDEPTVLHGIIHLFKQRKIPFSSSAVLVHRLDKDTTGCLLVAKTPAAHKFLQKQFENRTVSKFYLAIVAGVPAQSAAVIDASIGRSTSNRTKMTVLGSSKTREAKTTYRTLGISPDKKFALVSCELHTGRTHQIRVHLHAIGHPILGDPTYSTPTSRNLSEEVEATSVCLHAWQLTFRSPADEKDHTVTAVPPSSFTSILDTIGVENRFDKPAN